MYETVERLWRPMIVVSRTLNLGGAGDKPIAMFRGR